MYRGENNITTYLLHYAGFAEVVTEVYQEPTQEDVKKYEQLTEESYKTQVRPQ